MYVYFALHVSLLLCWAVAPPIPHHCLSFFFSDAFFFVGMEALPPIGLIVLFLGGGPMVISAMHYAVGKVLLLAC